MNINNVFALADYIEEDKSPVNFSSWADCLAGKCVRMLGKQSHDMRNADVARDFMGISATDAIQMFFPYEGEYVSARLSYFPRFSDPWMKSMKGLITNKMVASMLRNYVLTGKVDWQLAIEGPKEINTAKPPFPTPEEYRVKHYSLLDVVMSPFTHA